MPWVKVDDAFANHPKVDDLLSTDEMRGLAAVGLWTLGLSRVGQQLTDGELSERAVLTIAPENARTLAAELVRVGLWEKPEAGWVVHDYLEHNPSRAEVEAERAKRSEKARRAAKARWEKQRAMLEASGEALPERCSGPLYVDAPDPTRPDPSSTDVETDDPRERAVVVVPPPPVVLEETDKVCDTLAAVGLHVHDRTAMESLLGEFPEVDGVEAAIQCANWARGKRAKHPLTTLRPFLAAPDARRKGNQQGDLSKYDEGTIHGVVS